MNDNTSQSIRQRRFADVFAHLRDQDIEQFYANYQLWVMRQRLPILEHEIQTLHAHIQENQRSIQAQRPSAIALAVLARLQANGVSDIELLDQMLERGEDWLDRMMQRLDYCEQVEDFIQGDYTQWCANSLEGAYDWIDSLRGSSEVSQAAETSNPAEIQATEEMLLHKLSFDDEETMQDLTTKRPALTPPSEAIAEESLIREENPTYEQALAILTGEDVELANEISLETELSPAEPISPTEQADESAQPAPWYSLSLEENAAFDFEQPGSMDDWIKILQADTSSSTEMPATASSASNAAEALAPTMPEEPIEQVEEVASDLAEPEAQVENAAIELPETNEAEPTILELVSEAEPDTSESATSAEYEAVSIQETAASASETLSEQEKETQQESDELLSIAEGEAGSAHSELARELSAEAAALNEPELGEEAPDGTDKLAASEQIEISLETALPEEEDTSESLEVATTPVDEEEAASESPEAAITPADEEEAASEPLEVALTSVDEAEAMSQEHVQPAEKAGVEEPANTEEEAQTESEEYVEEELAPTLENAAEKPQNEIEEAAIVNAILEPEEGQLPWYEYLALEKKTSGELQSQNEIEEQFVPAEDLSTSTADTFEASTPTSERDDSPLTHEIIEEEISTEGLDETQPLALKKIQWAQQEQSVVEAVPLANADETFAEIISAPEEGKVNEEEATLVETEEVSEVDTVTEMPVVSEASKEITEKLSIPQSVPPEPPGVIEVYDSEMVRDVESVPRAVPPIAIEPEPIQEKPAKRSFWQWLFGKKRQK